MGWSAGGVVSAVVTARIAIVGDENETLPSHRELNAVARMLGDDVDSEWVPTDGPCGGLQYAVVEYFRNVLGVRRRMPSPTERTRATWLARLRAA